MKGLPNPVRFMKMWVRVHTASGKMTGRIPVSMGPYMSAYYEYLLFIFSSTISSIRSERMRGGRLKPIVTSSCMRHKESNKWVILRLVLNNHTRGIFTRGFSLSVSDAGFQCFYERLCHISCCWNLVIFSKLFFYIILTEETLKFHFHITGVMNYRSVFAFLS